ncbi:MBL fold metallo-hydrolase [Aquibacillus sp. 3ASR75-11]|uniref:MBL fold metallo-hydrolase n=1 Tax=Terrihalobacillus insolitus TaxID=2950438 RepID=A0A9X4AP71_9BACI|nr:MBL fold metallo-hydrolase [Terrihalobacillus insolitus]MDC3413451.1 MBL fold metallo-hydrolase [Terrihalobacillus insolitus]MDC3425258.1 MBL fold metallo-hydrolase [Terrihalobacillus insolitus]
MPNWRILLLVFILTFIIPQIPMSHATAESHVNSYQPWDFILNTKTSEPRNKEMKVHFIDVGQGDSILIETPNGKNMLIDGGAPSKGKDVVRYLKKEGITTIDLVVSTHPDVDHVGGLAHVLEELNVKKVLDSGKLHTTEMYYDYINQIKKHNIPVELAQEGQKIELDPKIDIKVLNDYRFMKTNNQASLVLSVKYGSIDFLLMGDVEIDQEQYLLDRYNLRSEIVKVGHHGSDSSSSFEFLQKVDPEAAILTYGPNNEFGHPVDRVIENLQQVGSTIYSTAKSGNIVITTDGNTYDVKVSGKSYITTDSKSNPFVR